MPTKITDGQWEVACAHCFNESDVVYAATDEAAQTALRAAGWLSAHPEGEAMKWWCIHCRAKLFESGNRGRKR